jgi:hypothetical protein
MPKVIRPIPDTDETVVRPVMLDVIRQVLKYTEISEENVEIFYPGTVGKTFQPGSSLSKDTLPNQLKGAFYNQVAVECDEQYQHDRILATSTFRPDNLFFFRDDSLEVGIRPTYSPMDCSISIKFRARDKNTAIKWRDQIRQRVSHGRMTYMHDITYFYFIPMEYLVILKEIHRLRENVAGYGQDWDTYFRGQVTPLASEQTDLAGKNKAWSIGETQMEIVGFFDFDGAPEQGSREDGGETWTISVNYKFQYDKPVGAVFFYPLVIHNQLLDQKYRPEKGPYEVKNHRRAYSMSSGAFAHFEKGRMLAPTIALEGTQLPSFDEFIPGQIVQGTQRVITVMISIDPDNPSALLNLATDLNPYWLDPDVVAFMQGEAAYMTTPWCSVFNLTLYAGDAVLNPCWLSVDSNLNVTTNQALSLRKYYHVRLSIHKDWSLLSADALTRLRTHCTACLKIFDTLDPFYKRKNAMPLCLPGDILSNSAMNGLVNTLANPMSSQGNGQSYGMMTVNTLSILTYRPNSQPR